MWEPESVNPMRSRILSILSLGLVAVTAFGQEPAKPRRDDPPVLRLQPGGPTSFVTGLVFSPDGKTLYEAGWDKVVRVWITSPGSNRLTLDDRLTFRVPVGPGLDGAINAMALSSDGAWLAVAGRGLVPGASGFHQDGLVIPSSAKTDAMFLAEGTIYVFKTDRSAPNPVTVLNGHRGPVLSLKFAPTRPDKPPLLVSAAHDRDRNGEVRLWDVTAQQTLRTHGDLPGPVKFKTRPAIAVWHTGAGPTQVRVAIAWWAGEFGKDQGILHCWDAATNEPFHTVTDGAVNDTLVLLPGASELLSGSVRLPIAGRRAEAPEGQLSVWRIDQGPGIRAEPQRRLALRPRDPKLQPQAIQLPRALDVVKSPADGAPRYAVTILQDLTAKPPRSTYSLRLTDLSAASYGRLVAQVPIRLSSLSQSAQPVLAVDPAGERIAVALGEEREIAAYFVADLLAGKVEPRQRLRNTGVTMAYVGFAKRNGDHALVFNSRGPDRMGAPARDLAPDDRMFDFSRRVLTEDHRGWIPDRPASGHSWVVEPVFSATATGQPGPPRSIRARQGRDAWRTVELPAGESVTAFAFHPKAMAGEPLIAVASQARAGEPFLRVYLARTGDWVRQYTGHTERIGCLAFSEDGRLLASTAADRTTCVWSLVDLAGTLGKRGQIRGLAVTAEGDRLVVTKGETPTGPGEPKLRPGDVVGGIVSGGSLTQPRSVVDFYNAVSMLKPGEPAAIARIEGPAKRVDVPVTIVQGTDERKPLLSLYITPGDAEQTWKWVGWNPQGPYETSDPGIESLIGWHFNTGELATPTRFALAPEYRDRFYHDHILKDLIERGSLPPPQAPPLPAPNLSMAVDRDPEIVGIDQLLVHQPPSVLSLSVVDRPIPPELVNTVTAQVGDLGTTELQSTADGVWTADVSKLPWKPGIYPIKVTLTTKETPAQAFTAYRRLRIQHAAPVLKPAGEPVQTQVVNQPDYLVRVDVQPTDGVAVKVQVIQEPGEVIREQVVRAPTPLAIPATLTPGTNRFRVRALNLDPVPGFEEDEATELPPLIVTYKKKTLAPTIELSVEAPGTDPNIVPRGGETIRVTTRKAVLRGRIAGTEPLVEAERTALDRQPPPRGERLAGFVAGRDPVFRFEEPVVLNPGSQTFVIRARAADSDWGEGRITVVYQPLLPRLVRKQLSPDRPVLFERDDPPVLTLKARFAPPADSHAVQGEILLNAPDQPQPRIIPTTLGVDQAKAGQDTQVLQLTAEIPLSHGENRIRIRLSNEWGAEWVSAEDLVAFRRPPRILEVKAPVTPETGSTTVAAVVESATDLSEAQVEVLHGGESTWARAEFSRQAGSTWNVTSVNVPLEPGESHVRVRARNEDGWNHNVGPAAALTFTRPVPKEPPMLEAPQIPLTTGLGEIPVPIAVRSARPLVKTELRRLLSESDWETVEVGRLEPAGQDDRGRTRYRGTATARLNDGLNHFELIATSEDGPSRLKFVVSRIQPPIRFAIDGFGVEADRTTVLPPNRPVAEGRTWIVGRVIWPDAEVQRRSGSARLQVLVNGFPQVESPLRPARGAAPASGSPGNGPLETPFRAGILLNRPENRVELKLSGTVAASDRLPVSINCLKPNLKQRLHMLVIGIGAQDKLALKRLAIQAVNGELASTRSNERVFKTPAFTTGRVYGPLCDEFTKMHVMAQISLICEQIRLRNNSGEAPDGSEVVLIYYQGGEWLGDDKASLLIRRGRDRQYVEGVTVDELVRPFVNTRGAKLLLLDVASAGPFRHEELWSRDVSHVGLMRFLWLSSANEEQPVIPDELRLLKVVKDILPRSITLGQATSEIAGRYSRLRSKYPNHFVFEDEPLPDPFSDLLFGKP